MKKLIMMALLMGALTACHGMESQIGGKDFPQPTPNFAARTVQAYSYDKVYEAAIDTLKVLDIPIANESKEHGYIRTDYVPGPTMLFLGGLGGTTNSRYKFSVTTMKAGNNTKLGVTAYLESSGNQVQSWRDISGDNQETVKTLQNFLIQQIQNNLEGKAVTDGKSAPAAAPAGQ